MTGIHKFRFSANFTYNEKVKYNNILNFIRKQRIKEELISDVEETLDRITFERDYDDRSEELSDLIGNMPRTILREIQMQVYQILNKINILF